MFYGIGQKNKRRTVSRVEIPGFDVSFSSEISEEDAVKVKLAVLRKLTDGIIKVPLSDGVEMTVTFILGV